jgi:hypothetical protein
VLIKKIIPIVESVIVKSFLSIGTNTPRDPPIKDIPNMVLNNENIAKYLILLFIKTIPP